MVPGLVDVRVRVADPVAELPLLRGVDVQAVQLGDSEPPDVARLLAAWRSSVLPGDPRLRPALERAMPADTIPNDTFRQAGVPVDVLFGEGHWRPAKIVARWPDRHGREVVQVEWFAELSTWTEEYLADPEKIREDGYGARSRAIR